MTQDTERQASANLGSLQEGASAAELVVSSEMIDAAIKELQDHRLGEDLRYVAEKVLLAMHYARLSASRTIERK